MSNQLTPMQEAIEKLKEKKNMFEKATKSHSDIRGTYQIAIFVLESLLPKEQQVIEVSWIDGKENIVFGDNIFDDAKQYYKTKFKQNGK